jgi:hypothetical protein
MEGLAEIITDFFNSIDPKRTLAGSKSRSAAVPRCAIPFVQAREVKQ